MYNVNAKLEKYIPNSFWAMGANSGRRTQSNAISMLDLWPKGIKMGQVARKSFGLLPSL